MTPGRSTICLPLGKDDYLTLIDGPTAFRRWIDDSCRDSPELFPEGFSQGYLLKNGRASAKLGLLLRRIECKATGRAFTVRPTWPGGPTTSSSPCSCGVSVSPSERWPASSEGIPCTGIASRSAWDATASSAPPSDAWTFHGTWWPTSTHQTHDGRKAYVATVVAEGCRLGASAVDTCDEVGLTEGYGVFRTEARTCGRATRRRR